MKLSFVFVCLLFKHFVLLSLQQVDRWFLKLPHFGDKMFKLFLSHFYAVTSILVHCRGKKQTNCFIALERNDDKLLSLFWKPNEHYNVSLMPQTCPGLFTGQPLLL